MLKQNHTETAVAAAVTKTTNNFNNASSAVEETESAIQTQSQMHS